MVVLVRELNGCAARIAQNGKGAETLVVGERNSVVSSIVGRIGSLPTCRSFRA